MRVSRAEDITGRGFFLRSANVVLRLARSREFQHRKMFDNKTHDARSQSTIKYTVTIFVRVVRYGGKYCKISRNTENKQLYMFSIYKYNVCI